MRARTKAVLNRLGIDNEGEDIAEGAEVTDPRALAAETSKAGRRAAFEARLAAMDDDPEDRGDVSA